MIIIDPIIRECPADIYDTLELHSLAFGGIGYGTYLRTDMDSDTFSRIPCCIHGQCASKIPDDKFYYRVLDGYEEIKNWLYQVAITESLNDFCLRRYLGTRPEKAVTWEEYCKLFNIVRV